MIKKLSNIKKPGPRQKTIPKEHNDEAQVPSDGHRSQGLKANEDNEVFRLHPAQLWFFLLFGSGCVHLIRPEYFSARDIFGVIIYFLFYPLKKVISFISYIIWYS